MAGDRLYNFVFSVWVQPAMGASYENNKEIIPDIVSSEPTVNTYEEVQFFNGHNYFRGLDCLNCHKVLCRSDEGLTLETSVFESFTVANLPHRPLIDNLL